MPGGASTGASSSPGPASADYFRLRAAVGPVGIYRYRLSLTAGADGHIPSLRGLAQSSAGVVQAGTDTDLQFSSAGTTPPRYNEWYDFGGGAYCGQPPVEYCAFRM